MTRAAGAAGPRARRCSTLRCWIDAVRRRAKAGRQGGGEDEVGRIGAHRVDDAAAAGDVAAHHAEALGERALDDVDAVHQAVALGDAAAARAVHADRMHFVDIGVGAVLLGEIADRRDRRDVAIHRIDRFEHDQLGALATGRRAAGLRRCATSLWRKICFSAPDWRTPWIIEAWLSSSEKITQFGQQPGDGRDRGFVGDEAGGEDQRRFLAVQVGESRSSSTSGWLVPEMLRVPPAPTPMRCAASHARRSRPGAGPCRDSRWSTRR